MSNLFSVCNYHKLAAGTDFIGTNKLVWTGISLWKSEPLQFYLVVPCQCCYITAVLVIPVLFS